MLFSLIYGYTALSRDVLGAIFCGSAARSIHDPSAVEGVSSFGSYLFLLSLLLLADTHTEKREDTHPE